MIPDKVYVVIGGWDYEGHDAPEGIFANRKDALKKAEEVREDYDTVRVLEYEVTQ